MSTSGSDPPSLVSSSASESPVSLVLEQSSSEQELEGNEREGILMRCEGMCGGLGRGGVAWGRLLPLQSFSENVQRSMSFHNYNPESSLRGQRAWICIECTGNLVRYEELMKQRPCSVCEETLTNENSSKRQRRSVPRSSARCFLCAAAGLLPKSTRDGLSPYVRRS